MTRLLLIDSPVYHNPYFLSMLEKEGGYEVSLVTNQEDYETNSRKYDLVLFADLKISGREKTNGEPCKIGLDILKDLRERGLPVLVLRSIEPKEVGEQARALGARVLKKPLSFQDILKNLKELGPEKREA